LQPNIALGHALRELGHDVAFYTGASVRSQLEAEGFACLPFRELNESSVRLTVEQLVNLRGNPRKKRDLWREFLVATVPAQLRDLEVILNGFRADAIVCDLAMWAPILVVGETRRLPVIAFSHVGNCLLPGPEGPVTGFALPHSRNLLVDLYGRAVSLIANAVAAPVRREASGIRIRHGLPPLSVTVTEFAGRMPLYLVPSAPEFDYLRKDLPASVHYTGPCLWDRPKDHAPPDFVRKIDPARKCIVVDEGGLYRTEPKLFELAVEGLRNTPVQVVLIAGHGRDPEALNLGPLPPAMTLTRNTPLSDVLPVADLLLTNGNSNAVLAALSCGVPVVVLPSIWDQAEVAWRVHETGTGLRLAPRRCTPERLRSAVLRVLEQPSFRENAERMAVALRRPGGPARAAGLIEKLVTERGGEQGAEGIG
jgi:UDP:flavonoid glycosyltransferase YjiC (YdhE family)